jgi:hypothetical protein
MSILNIWSAFVLCVAIIFIIKMIIEINKDNKHEREP